MIKLGTTAVAVVCLLAGCISPIRVHHLEYPENWPAPIPAASGCPNLAGRYLNADLGPRPRLLAEFVLPRTQTSLGHIHLVEIDGPRQGGVTFRLVEGPVADDGSGGTEVGRREWKAGPDYQCEDGWLVLSSSTFAPIPVYIGFNSVRFAPGRDGTLVVEQRGSGGGVFLVMPGYVASNSWHMFRQAVSRTPAGAQ